MPLQQYRERICQLVSKTNVSRFPVMKGFGQTLAEDIVAEYPVPLFDNSAMDGFAVRHNDLEPLRRTTIGVSLQVVGDIPAGARELPRIGPGQAARIMTGAPIPEGADTVIPVELTDQPLGSSQMPREVLIRESVSLGRHIRRKGENIMPADTLLAAGASWTPAAASAAVSVGLSSVALYEPPRVSIISTGSELVAPGVPPLFGQIPDSNSTLLTGLVQQFGGVVHSGQSVSDSPEDFANALQQAQSADVIITSGGVSVGAFEVVRQVVENEVEFVNVAMQPGKPQGCGLVQTAGRKIPLIALPGNPVSVFVSAWVFVRPFLRKAQGMDITWRSSSAVVAQGWNSPADREQFVPVRETAAGLVPVHALVSGSHLIASLALATALARVPVETTRVHAGESVEVFEI